MTARDKALQYQTHNRRYNFLRIWNKRYYHMKARHDGHSTNYSHSNGKGILSKEEFLEWCMDFNNLQAFITLYFDWAAAEFDLSLSPSVDRINPDEGYVVGNLQWLAFNENCEKNHKYIDPRTKKMVRELA